MTTGSNEGPVVLDDGLFYIELNCNYPSDEAPGFLQHRCYQGVTTPGGYECVGSFERDAQGQWRASVDAPYHEESGGDSRHLGSFADRLDAIATLWGARHGAHCRHKDA